MKGSMMKRLTRTVAATGAVIGVLLAAATPSAFADISNLRLGCFVDSPALDTLTPDHCQATVPARQNTIYYEVLGDSLGSYTYSWHTAGFIVSFGCTPSSVGCAVLERPAGGDWSRTMSVDVTDPATGSAKTVSATAEGFAVCSLGGRLVWC
jgi:hypothetical protein